MRREPRRVAVFLKGFLGDVVMATPVFDELERRFPEVEYLTMGGVAPLLWRPGPERRSLSTPRVRRLGEVVAQARMIRRERYDMAVLINHSFRSALTAQLARIPVRVGHATEHRSWLLNPAVSYSQTRNETSANYDLLRALGIKGEEGRPHLPVTPEERGRGDELRAGASVGIQPGARFQAKRVPYDVMGVVARQIAAQGHRLVMLGGETEAPQATEVMSRLEGVDVVDLVTKTNLRETLGVLQGLDLVVGSDTGLMHMAAAVGTPTVTVFGPTPASKWGHHYPPHAVVESPGGRIEEVTAKQILAEVWPRLRATVAGS